MGDLAVDEDEEGLAVLRYSLRYLGLNKKSNEAEGKFPDFVVRGLLNDDVDSGLEFTPHIHRTLSQ